MRRFFARGCHRRRCYGARVLTPPCRVILLALVCSCGTSSSDLPAGAVCDETADCDTGLMCLDFAQVTSTSCMTIGKLCSTPCVNDASCAPLGADFKCFATCTAEKVCGQVLGP